MADSSGWDNPVLLLLEHSDKWSYLGNSTQLYSVSFALQRIRGKTFQDFERKTGTLQRKKRISEVRCT